MSLIGALNTGKSALATHQAALQVTGNNIANAGNPDYTRQVAHITPAGDQQVRPGMFIGTGINLSGIQRQIDEALEARLRGSISGEAAAATLHQWIGRLEAVFNELTNDDLSTRLSEFFNAWSNLANNPADAGLRQVVLQTGQAVASSLQSMRGELGLLQRDVDARLAALSGEADRLARQVADLNRQIALAEGGGGGQANGLRDQRDVVLKQLSELIDIRTIPGESGMINVHVGSEPLVIGADSRGVGLRQDTVDGQPITTVTFRATGGAMNIAGGQVGGLIQVRQQLDGLIDQLDSYAGSLIFELNKVHASGQGLIGFTSTTATNAVGDASAPLTIPASGLAFVPAGGSVVIHVKDPATGLLTSTLVEIDGDTTLESLRTSLDGIDGMSASIANGRLQLEGQGGATITFSQDSSGLLAALGINTFFTGSSAADIAANAVLRNDPRLLAAALNGEPGDNRTAVAIAALESAGLASLGGSSLMAKYQSMVNGVAGSAAAARTQSEAARVVRETLHGQREALSGVSLDEEAVNLMKQQRAFQGAARLVAAVDEMMRTVLNLV